MGGGMTPEEVDSASNFFRGGSSREDQTCKEGRAEVAYKPASGGLRVNY